MQENKPEKISFFPQTKEEEITLEISKKIKEENSLYFFYGGSPSF